MLKTEDQKDHFRTLFLNKLLKNNVIFDLDFDGLLSIAFINSVLKKKINIAGVKYRFRDKTILKQNNIKTSSCLGILSTTDWEECSFIDFEVHNCYSIGHHFLLQHGNKMINPNKQFFIDGEKSPIFVQKYPLSTLTYLVYLFDSLENYSEEQLKYLAIPDKTFQNSWPDRSYNDPYPKYLYLKNGSLNSPRFSCTICKKRKFLKLIKKTVNTSGLEFDKWKCENPACQNTQPFLLRGYRENFLRWEEWLNFNGLNRILEDFGFYYALFGKYPHIFGKYPPTDLDGLNLVSEILKKMNWELPQSVLEILNNRYDFKYLYLIPEYRKAPIKDRIPKDVFHHAKLSIRYITISRISEIKKIDL